MSRRAAQYIQAAVVAANVVGVGVSVYLTFVHFAAAQLVCSVSGTINCERVLSSAYGVIAGTSVPTSAGGIVWFGAGAVLAVAVWARPRLRSLARAQMAWSVVGLLTVIYFVFVEIVELGAICIWCTVAHVLVVGIFLATVTIRPSEA